MANLKIPADKILGKQIGVITFGKYERLGFGQEVFPESFATDVEKDGNAAVDRGSQGYWPIYALDKKK